MNLPTDYQSFIHISRYARYRDDLGRREIWPETVKRYFDFFEETLKEKHNFDLSEIRPNLEKAVLNLEIMPSMRALMTAGPALKRSNVAGFNCSYIACDDVRAFDETLYVLMCGTGVGFSVERQFVSKLPKVPDSFEESGSVIVEDSKEGWAAAMQELIAHLYSGRIPSVDYSKVRPAGARLKTFGGRASGPEPLKDLFEFTVRIFQEARGRQLESIECHRILCKIGECVVVGGVRRSAMISLSNLSDDRMRHAKSGQWWVTTPEMSLANNSVAYTENPEVGAFMREWLALYESKSGERGIFNRDAVIKKMKRLERRDPSHDFGTNPCGEILLRSAQFCNLTEVVIRSEDTFEQIANKISMATVLGTLQSTMTTFDSERLRPIWEENTKEERLLGVSLTGILDNDLMKSASPEMLSSLKNIAIQTNEIFAAAIGIETSAAITCVKPSGTVSQLVDSSSGIHARHSEFYIRTVRADKKDPLTQFMISVGFPHEDCVMRPDTTTIFSFPQRSPHNSVTRNDMTALQHLEIWKNYQMNWCEHNPSVTITVREEEWPSVGAYVYDNFDQMSGVSFLPHSEHTYKQAPYQDCSEEEYLALLDKMPKNVDWTGLKEFEKEDNTVSSQTLACSGGSCEIVNIGS